MVMLSLSLNDKEFNLVFGWACLQNILDHSINIINVFSFYNFFLVLGFMQYWLRWIYCCEIRLNGVLKMAFLLENRLIFPVVLHWFLNHLWFNSSTVQRPSPQQRFKFNQPSDIIFTSKLRVYYWHKINETVYAHLST